ncbi:MAG TPA: tetratricopeptide repeat protein [Tepidisphaeraceae bacterium]
MLAVAVPFHGGLAAEEDFLRDTIPTKWIDAIVPENLPALKYPAYYNNLDKARLQSFTGRYKLSLVTLKQVKDADAVQVVLVKAQSLSALGRKLDALKILSDPAVIDKPQVQLLRARIEADLGWWTEAIALLKDHLKQHPDSLAGHFYLGQFSEETGDMDTAKKAYAWFIEDPQNFLQKWMSQPDKFDNAEDVVLIGRALDRNAILTSAYQADTKLHEKILGMFVKAYDVIDRAYWPAHVAAGEYFLSHDMQKEAGEEINAALAANPQDIHALEIVGQMGLSQYNFDQADKVIDAIRRIQRDSVRGDVLDARNLLLQRKAREAEAPVAHVLALQPKNLEALGLLAAINSLQLKDDKTAEILRHVETLDPDNASTYLEVAEQLAALRQYPRSAAMYQIAIKRAPWWTGARNGLGLLYTQSGDEDLARLALDAAHELDPFNVRTTNYLRLLDDLDKFAKLTTKEGHFVISYDAEKDPLIPEYFGEYLESIYKDVCADFKCEPPVTTFIEVFPTHDAFSVRTTGSPWIGTVGASTGRVIALVSPRKGENTMGTYNWADVLRHEFTHTVTLAATDNRIAHWMTEGLAVYEEHMPLRWEWVPMLYNAVKKHELFTMDGLTWGFVRPKKPSDRQLAYAQSFWICKYLEDTYGHQAVLTMLEEFRKGGVQDDVFPKVIGRSLSQFTTEFFAWTDAQVATWGYDPETSKKYADLRKKGDGQIKSRQFKEAAATFEEIVKIRPVDALPHARLAGLYLTKEINQPERAIEQLKILESVELKDNRYDKRISGLYRDMHKLEPALQYALHAVYVDPYDMDAHELLAKLYEMTSNTDGLAREQRVIPVLAEWIKVNRKKVDGPEPEQPAQ